jgi:Putative prokaryotic signal transducing protein
VDADVRERAGLGGLIPAGLMKTLYEASSAVEAHMVLDLLRQEGLTAHIHGEHLQGAIGELPAAGLVRVVVDEADHAQARDVVARWEAEQPKEAVPRSSARMPRAIYGLLAGLVLGIAGTYAFYRSPATVDGVDYNRDGLLDEKWTYAPSGRMQKVEIDRNLDGKVDYIAHYDGRGLIESADSDDNFDGVFESKTRFRAGNVEFSETDTDGDGYPDLRYHHENGVLLSMEVVNPSTGLPRRVEHYKLGRLTMTEVDTDGDGTLDRRDWYGKLSDVIASETIRK